MSTPIPVQVPSGCSDNLVLNELQLLLSMYTHKSQVRFNDPEITEAIDQYMNGEENADLEHALNSSVSFTVRPQDDLEIHVRIPAGYPTTEKISATCSSRIKDGDWVTNLNSDLRNMIQNAEAEDGSNSCDILSVINFCQEYVEDKSISVPSTSDKNAVQVQPSSVSRIWIYSHHIYNKKKRKFLIDTASELSLNGFSMPGKPGFICIEGEEGACDEYWARVRQLSWQRISLITKENLTNSSTEVRFNTFEELNLTKSEFIKYLDAKQISFVIKEYLNF